MTWRQAVVVVLATRVAAWVAAALALLVASPRRNPLLDSHSWHPRPFPEHSLLTHVLLSGDRWDAKWYLGIARDGYGEAVRETAFFPLFPLLTAGLGYLVPSLVVAGTIVAIAGAVLTTWLLGAVVRRLGGTSRAALGAGVLWCTWPAAVVLGSPYPESLAAAGIAGAWLLALDGRRRLAGLAAGLAILAKPLGVAALPFVLLQRSQPGERPWRTRQAWEGIGVAAAVSCLWPAFLWGAFGSPLRFLEAQGSWGRTGSWLGPLDGAWRGAREAGEGLGAIVTGPLDVTRDGVPNFGDAIGLGMQDVLNLGLVVLLAAGSVLAWRRFGAAAGVAVLACVLVPLATASDDVPLMSAPRFVLLALPCFVLAAMRLSRGWGLELVTACSAVLFGVGAAGWATWQWLY